MNKRFADSFPDDSFIYAPLQLYLCRIHRENLPLTGKKEPTQFRESLRLVDGAREKLGGVMLNFSRNKLMKGTYILFYRAAWATTP